MPESEMLQQCIFSLTTYRRMRLVVDGQGRRQVQIDHIIDRNVVRGVPPEGFTRFVGQAMATFESTIGMAHLQFEVPCPTAIDVAEAFQEFDLERPRVEKEQKEKAIAEAMKQMKSKIQIPGQRPPGGMSPPPPFGMG